MAHQCYCWVTCSWSIGPSHNVYFFWFVLHRKMHCSFSILHTIHIHTALARFGFLENHQSTLTTYHRRISANASKQGKKATVSTARCVFQWHAIQHGLAINCLEAVLFPFFLLWDLLFQCALTGVNVHNCPNKGKLKTTIQTHTRRSSHHIWLGPLDLWWGWS
jgi:hypothetical protein